MFFRTPKEAFVPRVNELLGSLPDSMTAYQAFSYIAPVVALVGEGHTNAEFPVESYLNQNPYWLPERPYIDKKDMTLKLAEAGFEYQSIVSINGRTNRQIVDQLLSYFGTETIYGKVFMANVMMHGYFPLVDSSHIFSIEYIDKEGALKTTELEGVRIIEYQKRIGVRNENGILTENHNPDPLFRFSRVNPSTVLFTMPAFDKEQAPHVIDSMFAYIKSDHKVKNLIIDLRGNLGGSATVYNQLMNYLSPIEFSDYYAYSILCASDRTKEYDLPKATPYPAEKRFNGNLYVLIDNGSYSCSILFSYEVQRLKLGTLIGEETGGSVFMHGYPWTLTVAWGLELKCSYVILKVPDLDHYKKTMEPVYPDIEVPSDKALDKALEVTASPRRK